MKGGVNDMVIKNINLETVCGITSVLPENDKPEIAFAGKSNVGKSSLINALMDKPSTPRFSRTTLVAVLTTCLLGSTLS